MKVPLVTINRVIEEHLQVRPPTSCRSTSKAWTWSPEEPRLRSVPAPGDLHETIREDFRLSMPVMGTEITEFLSRKGYAARAMTYLNTIYVDQAVRS